MITIKRVYEKAEQSDGERILVERLWARGLTKAEAHVDEWMKEIAPSPELRKWYGHDVERWDEFQKRYRDELRSDRNRPLVEELRNKGRGGKLTLVYSARDTEHNSAMVLKEFLESR